jgi:hypothetical protein
MGITHAKVGMRLILIWVNGIARWTLERLSDGKEEYVPVSITSNSQLVLINDIGGSINKPAGTILETRRDGASVSFRCGRHDVVLERLPARLRVTVVSIGEPRPARPRKRHGYLRY